MTDQQEPAEYGFRQTEADESKGSILWFLLPFMIILRPGKFMLSWGIHAKLHWIILAAWLIGSSGMINTVVNRTRFAPDSLPISMDSWTTVWLVILGFGILRGVISYSIGGLWTWGRLRICGVRGNEWARSTRIFNFSMLVNEIPSLLALVYFSLRYDTLRDFIAQPVGLTNLIVGLIMLYSPVVGFVGVLACYRVRTIWATILFLLIPLSWRVAMVWYMLFSPGGVLLPDTQNPVTHTDERFVFDHPADWTVLPPKPLDEHTMAQVEIKSESGTASVLIRVLRLDGIDPNEHDLAFIETMGYDIGKKTVHPKVYLGELYGYGEEYELQKNGKQYKMFHMLAGLDRDHWVLVRSLASQHYEDASFYGVKQIVNSLVVSSVDEVVSDLEYPKQIAPEWFTHQAPGNWKEQVETHEQYDYVEQRAFGESYIRFTIYDRPAGVGPEKELSAVLENGMHRDRMIEHHSMNSWLGFEGLGATGTIWQPLWGMHDFQILFVPLKDGRTLGIKKYQAQSSADLTDPGFELIESTFKLLVEPASFAEPVDP